LLAAEISKIHDASLSVCPAALSVAAFARTANRALRMPIIQAPIIPVVSALYFNRWMVGPVVASKWVVSNAQSVNGIGIWMHMRDDGTNAPGGTSHE
jgi:hypothetical protein